METKIKIYLVCTGLGRVHRGFESFTRECYEALKSSDKYEVVLLKGAEERGKYSGEKVIWSIDRNSRVAKIFKKPYMVEQFTFFLGMMPMLFTKKPFLIFYSDLALGAFLWHFRRVTGLKYRLLLSNGGPNFPPFSRTDFVQQLLPLQKRLALKAGEPEHKHFVVPYGFNILKEKLLETKSTQRSRLNLPKDKVIIISVGVINRSHKRMDYLISEVAKLNKRDIFLLLLGAEDSETKEIREQAQDHLGFSNFLITTVSPVDISKYYQAADIFVLASTFEGFGRVLIEALAYDLPVVAHHGEVFQEVLGDMGILIDMEEKGLLSNQIQLLIESKKIGHLNNQTREKAYNTYSWDCLKGDYLRMFEKALS